MQKYKINQLVRKNLTLCRNHVFLHLSNKTEKLGNLTDVRAELMRAMVYSRTTEGFQFDTAIRIAERLVKNEKVLADPEMLHEQPDATISEVAEQVGLTLRNLQRLFREQYGMSPSEYRYSHK